MSDEPKKPRREVADPALAAYHCVRVLRGHALRHGQLGFGDRDGWVCVIYDQHVIGARQLRIGSSDCFGQQNGSMITFVMAVGPWNRSGPTELPCQSPNFRLSNAPTTRGVVW